MTIDLAATDDWPHQPVCPMFVSPKIVQFFSRIGFPRGRHGGGSLGWQILCGWLLWSLVGGVALGQTTSTPTTVLQDDSLPKPTRVQVSELDTYYVPDKDGKLIPVFRLPFEEFERLMQRQRAGETSPAPTTVGFRVVQANFSGEADAALSRVGLRLRMQVLLSQSGWQQIPLGLHGWVLQGVVQGPESTAHYLTRAENGSFLLHVNGPVGEILQFELPLSGSVRRLGHVRQLPLGFPHPTEMSVRLELPATGLEVRGGDLTDLQAQEVDGRTVVQVRELTERSTIAWQNVSTAPASFPLKARVDTLLRVQSIGVGTWQVNTLLNLTPLNQPVSELTLAIPVDAQNFSTQQSSIRVERVTEAEAQQTASQVPPGLQYVRLLFDTVVTEPTQLQLTYTIQGESEPERMESRVELSGPQVMDCLFTNSSLELSKDREVATQWQLGTGISLRASTQEKSEATFFSVERQDFRLTLLNRPQAVQVRVSSEYELIVTQQILMTARFHCQIQGKFNAPLWLDLGNWQFLTGDSGIQAQDGRLLIDPSAQAVSPDGDLRFGCTLLMETSDQFDLALPRLQGEASLVQQPGRIMLVLGDSSEFNFDAAGSTVLRDASSPVQFRARDANSEIVLRGQLGVRARAVTMQQSSTVLPPNELEDGTVDGAPIRHEVALEVAHQPLPGLSFLLPATAPLQQLQVQFGTELLTPKTTIVRVAEQDFHAIEFPIAPERLRGQLKFVVTHWLGPEAFTASAAEDQILVPVLQVVTEPLTRLVPVKDQEALHEFLTRQVAGFQIQQREIRTPDLAGQRFWISTPPWGGLSSGGSRESSSRWILNGPWPMTVQVTREQVAAPSPEVVVEAVHVRTWWSGDQRREQMVATVLSQEETMTVQVPAEIDVRRVLVDGQPVDFKAQPNTGVIEFGWESDDSTSRAEPSEPSRRELEIWYAQNQVDGVWTHLTLRLPQLPNQQWCREFTWAVAASDWWRIFWASNELTLLPATTSLEAVPMDGIEGPEATALIHVYRSSHEPSQHGLLMIHRRWFRIGILVLVSGIVLLTWILRWYRSAAYWLGGALIVVAMAWWWPPLGWEAAPWVLLASTAALLVLWVEYATRARVAGNSGDLFSDTTRTYWNDLAIEKERSAPSLSKPSSVAAGEPT